MSKYQLIIFLVLNISFVFSQEKEIALNWKSQEKLQLGNESILVPEVEGFEFNNVSNGIFTFYKTWEVESVDYSGAEITDLKYENISADKLGTSVKSSIPLKFSYEVYLRNSRSKKLNILTFTPIIKEGNNYKRVVSFSLKSNNAVFSASNLSSKSAKSAELISSVLSSGEWYRFKVDTTGVYKITPQFLNSLGINLSNVDANTIKIYGNGGQHLPYLNSDNEIYDIRENPIQIFGAQDGNFSGNDYILFYGKGSKEYVIDDATHINPYSDDAFYYVTFGGNESKKIANDNTNFIATQTLNSYTHYSFYEVDEYNLGNMGRRWFGDKFDSFTTNKIYEFDLPELTSDGEIQVQTAFASIFASPPSVLVNILNGTQVVSPSDASEIANNLMSFGTIGQNDTFNSQFLTINLSNAEIPLVNNDFNVRLNFQQGADITSEGFLDYLIVRADCVLKAQDKQFGFETIINFGEIGEYVFENSSTVTSVWNVTDPFSITKKDKNGSNQLSFIVEMDSPKKIVVLDEDDFYTPETVSNTRVVNQDLKTSVLTNSNNQFEAVDYLIITNQDFVSAGSRLANFRSQQDGYNAKVVDVQDIYTEFSAGVKDVVAIRNFVKYIYDNSVETGQEESSLKYLCIIGDGSYDPKNRISNNNDHVPLYHSTQSSSVVSSFATDDFYTLMDDNEGANLLADKMDISVGRILARDAVEANSMVDKIINFYDRKTYGDWRNNMLFIADDVDQDSDADLQETIIEVSEIVKQNVPRVNVKLLVMDAFEQEITSAGERYSAVSNQLEDYFGQGMAYVNYFGHGGEDGITGEFIFTSETAQNLTNLDRLPVFVTLTCELTRFDNPNRETAGEYLYWNRIGGSVGLLTTTRQLFLSTGTQLNSLLVDELLDENNFTRSIGDILRILKDANSSSNVRTVFCIGDPAIKMALPKPQVLLTEVNGQIIDNALVEGEEIPEDAPLLEALGRVSINGKVVDGITGNDLPNYNGEVSILIFDKDIERTTLGNDRTSENGTLIITDFTESGSLVFKGLASVIDGNFNMEFILPKNVQLEEGQGKVSFYVAKNNENDDQSGANTSILIGGLNEDAAEDVTPPIVELFLNGETFFSGQTVGNSPLVYAKLSDDSGINTAGGVGHDIQIILDENETEPIVVNDFYITNIDDFTSGTLSYQLNNLEPGEHTLQLRVSDAYNNSSTQEITFVVNDDQNFILNNVLNYPNPFTSYTEFWFSHTSVADDILEVSVQIMTISGKIVTTKHITLSGEKDYRSALTWDAKDNFGNKLGKGVYLYKIIAKSTLTNNTATKIEKLVLL